MILPLKEELYRLIEGEGRIPFAQFMNLVLYWPKGGYYRGTSPVGSGGDYYTAPSAHPSFGALIVLQLQQMWRLLDRPNPFWVVEVGGGNGLLCHDVMVFSRNLLEEFQDSIRYVCLDIGSDVGVEAKISSDGGPWIQRIVSANLPMTSVVGCVISNELVDSFPVHRVRVCDGKLLEVYVTLKDGLIKEELDVPSSEELEARLEFLGIQLTEGHSAEINLIAESWLNEVSMLLERGYLITIDYGSMAEDHYSKPLGTLTTFYRHTQTDNPYVHLGNQDITAQVDFSALSCLGNSLGLDSLTCMTQERFLVNLGMGGFISKLNVLDLKQQERDANRMGMMELVRPGGMGEFKVLIQGKNVIDSSLWCLNPSNELRDILRELTPPLLGPLHTPLLAARYPYMGVDIEHNLLD